MDGVSMMRCMVVGLSREQEDACRHAIVPVEIVRIANVHDGCATMSTVLPLVVVVDESMSEGDRASLGEMASACGAEIVVAPHVPDNKVFASSLLDAVRAAERRRFGRF